MYCKVFLLASFCVLFSCKIDAASPMIDDLKFTNIPPLAINPLQSLYDSVSVFENSFIANPITGILSQSFFILRTLGNLFQMMPFNQFLVYLKDGVTTRASCLTCNILATLIRSELFSTNLLAFASKMICVLLRISTYEVCHGAIESFKNTFGYIRLNSILTSGEMCGLALGMNCALDITENLNWTIPLPEKRRRIVRKLSYNKKSKHRKIVAHLTDIHYDPYYIVGTRADCGEPVCCRSPANLLSSITMTAGLFGNYQNCDTPGSTIEKSIKMLNSHKLSYVIWTGDIPPHDIWNYTRTSNILCINEVHQMLNEIKVPIFPAIGNHEAVPVNSFAPPEIDYQLSNAWLYEKMAAKWSKWLPKSALQTVKYTGNYAVEVEPGLRIISLNTNYCARLNPWILYKSIDPGNQLKWLVDQLLYAESAGDKVHLIGHVPPDHKECTQPWLFNFIRIVERFRDVITAQFYGHTHRDEFRVLYSSERSNDAIGFELIAPSVTSYSATNPSYRIYQINEHNIVTDYETYTFNLTESHLVEEPQWYLEYKASSLFNVSTINASALSKILTNLESNSSFYSIYHRVYYTKSDIDFALKWNDRRRALLIDSHRVIKPHVAQAFYSLSTLS